MLLWWLWAVSFPIYYTWESYPPFSIWLRESQPHWFFCMADGLQALLNKSCHVKVVPSLVPGSSLEFQLSFQFFVRSRHTADSYISMGIAAREQRTQTWHGTCEIVWNSLLRNDMGRNFDGPYRVEPKGCAASDADYSSTEQCYCHSFFRFVHHSKSLKTWKGKYCWWWSLKKIAENICFLETHSRSNIRMF